MVQLRASWKFDEKNQGVITLKDVYDVQNVQGRNEMVGGNSGFVQQQARQLIVGRYVDLWARTASGLSAAEISGLKKAISHKS